MTYERPAEGNSLIQASEMNPDSGGVARVCKMEASTVERPCASADISPNDNAASLPSTVDETDEDDDGSLDNSNSAFPNS